MLGGRRAEMLRNGEQTRHVRGEVTERSNVLAHRLKDTG